MLVVTTPGPVPPRTAPVGLRTVVVVTVVVVNEADVTEVDVPSASFAASCRATWRLRLLVSEMRAASFFSSTAYSAAWLLVATSLGGTVTGTVPGPVLDAVVGGLLPCLGAGPDLSELTSDASLESRRSARRRSGCLALRACLVCSTVWVMGSYSATRGCDPGEMVKARAPPAAAPTSTMTNAATARRPRFWRRAARAASAAARTWEPSSEGRAGSSMAALSSPANDASSATFRTAERAWAGVPSRRRSRLAARDRSSAGGHSSLTPAPAHAATPAPGAAACGPLRPFCP